MTRVRGQLGILALQVLVLVVVLTAWEYLPRIEWLRQQSVFFDPFFISSPSDIGHKIVDLAAAREETPSVWPYARRTMEAALIGTGIGIVTGIATGLLFTASSLVDRVFRPFFVALNAVPRIALIPIIVTLFGITLRGAVVSVITVVFFIAFFNAYEGGRSVDRHVLQNASLLGASRWQIVRYVRLPYAVAWTLAALPLAVTFGIITAVTMEILTGYPGMGRLLSIATQTASASLTFATVIYLSVMGVVLTAAAEIVKRRALHWWAK